MAALMRAHDWSTSSLGCPAAWPQFLRSVVEMMLANKHLMFVAWGPDLAFLYNDGYRPAFGNKHPGGLGRPFREVWSEIWDDIEPFVTSALAGEATWSEDLPLVMERNGYPEEAWFTFSYSPLRDESGRIAGLFCAGTETTAQVLARRSMAAERERLFEMTRDLFGVATFDGYLKSINPAWSLQLDRPNEELTGRPFAEIIHPDDLAVTADVVAALQRGEPVHQFLVRLLKADGTPISFAWSAVPDADRSTNIFYTVGRDITEEQRREEMLRQSQKMEAVGQLTGGLAHDFNNLLAGISGSLELIQMRIGQGRAADVEKYIGAAQDATRRAAALTHRLLAFSRRQTLAPKPTDVQRLVAGMEDLLSRTVGPSVMVETVNAEDLWPSLIDPSQLENSVLNLCLNARDAMPDGGKITIETANQWLDQDTADKKGIKPGPYILLSVSDTGSGMSPEVIAKAFDPFFTTKPIGMGTGLGLSMVYGFARQSGGTVTISSQVGQGSAICVYLPRHAGALEQADETADANAIPRAEAGETVLIIDDEPTVRMLVSEVLGDLGYTAIEARDGAGGLKIVASDVRIDLLITDVGLPGGLNGRQVADAARAVRPDVKVLFITGYAESAVLGDGDLEHGMHVMTKPFAMEALASRIRELISG